MNILVAVASKHGSTYEIAGAIVDEFLEAGIAAELREINQNPNLTGYDAAIIGSAVYMGRWLKEATAFLEDNREQLLSMPVWLFSSGPLGDDLDDLMEDEGEPYNLKELLAKVNARGHKVFVGKLDTKDLGLGERLIIRLVKAPTGDFRNWEDVSDWANEIMLTLTPVPAS